MSLFLLEVEPSKSRAGRLSHHRTSRTFVQRELTGLSVASGCSLQVAFMNRSPDSLRAPSNVWTIINFLREFPDRSGWMIFHRKSLTHLLGCGFLYMVVLAHAEKTVAQMQRVRPANSSATGAKSAERADVSRFRKRVETTLAASGTDKGTWGVLVTDAATGEVYYERDADNYFAPASNAKLFTTAFALATLGPDYRVRTSIVSSGTRSTRTDC